MVKAWNVVNHQTGKTVAIPTGNIKRNSLRIVGVKPTAALSSDDAAFVADIQRRVRHGAKRMNDVMTAKEVARLEELDVDMQVIFETNSEFVPTLADEMLFHSPTSLQILDTRNLHRATSLLRSAQRFVLTEEAAIKVAKAIHDYPEMLVDHGVFARTPFDTCWIEFPSHQFHEMIVPGSSSPDSDTRVGYLFHNESVYVAAENADGAQEASWMPLVYHMHKPLSLEQEQALANRLNITRMQLDNFYWGGTMSQNLSRDYLRALRAQHGVSIRVNELYEGLFTGQDWLKTCAGEMRNIIGLLLMMNQPNILRMDSVKARRRPMSSKGPLALMSHSIITINLDGRSKPSRILRKPEGTHASPRWHNVIDHWCNDKVSRTTGYSIDDPRTYTEHALLGHAHEWEQAEDGSLRFTCKLCGGRRWRRKYKEGRGDKSRGMVSQDRIIKTDANKNITDKYFS